MATILVTGATGFLGRAAAAALLARGHAVHGSSRQPLDASAAGRPPGLGSPAGVTLHRADLLRADDRRALVETVRPDALLHLAWVTEHGHYWAAPENEDWVAASADLAALFRGAGGRRLVVGGTCAEYDWNDPALITRACNERRTPIHPRTPYGRARVALAQRLDEEASGLSRAWARIFFPFGPGEDQRRLVPSVAGSLLDGREAAVGPGTDVRDFIGVSETGAALAALLESPVEGPVNIGSGKGRSIASMVHRLAELVGRPELLRIGALRPRPDDPPHLVADVRRLTDEVGFTPRGDLDADIIATLEWWSLHRDVLADMREGQQ